jgi:hypothetical protein
MALPFWKQSIQTKVNQSRPEAKSMKEIPSKFGPPSWSYGDQIFHQCFFPRDVMSNNRHHFNTEIIVLSGRPSMMDLFYIKTSDIDDLIEALQAAKAMLKKFPDGKYQPGEY